MREPPQRHRAKERAEGRQPQGLGFVLCQYHGEPADQRANEGTTPAPSRQGARREPAIDQRQGNAACERRLQQIGPEFGFDPEREIRAPMIEKTRHPGPPVQGQILMQHIGRPPLGEKPRRGDRARGDEKMQIRFAPGQRLDQRQQGLHLAHACPMQPAQSAGGAREAGNAESLLDARGLLLAGDRAGGEVAAQQGACEIRRGAISQAHHVGSILAGAILSGANLARAIKRPSRSPPPRAPSLPRLRRRTAGHRAWHRPRRGP